MPHTVILWFRRDLRLHDNPALIQALHTAERLLPLYIAAPDEEAPWIPGAASRWWLHYSLHALAKQLQTLGSRLVVVRGPTLTTLQYWIAATKATHCFWNRCYEPAYVTRDRHIKATLQAQGITCVSCNGALWFEPWEVLTKQNKPFRVFTPYWRQLASRLTQLSLPELAPTRLPAIPAEITEESGLPIAALQLLPTIPWDHGLKQTWTPGEAGAWQQLERFTASALQDYSQNRDYPAYNGTSRLSPHLHFGEISPRQLLATLLSLPIAHDAYLRQLGWREFNTQILYHFPHTLTKPLNPRFDHFPWREQSSDEFTAWCQGKTGFPIIDAGLRELWHTGWMHNRVRMLVASLLTKNLRYTWQLGAQWFWDTLVDADLANNLQGWQWVAGCGADAAPYFRIFNPIRQGEQFDPQGDYIRQWCPELAQVPDHSIHQPWLAVAQASSVYNTFRYPKPIVDLIASRHQVLEIWQGYR
jgi:deoxyribodipyrimidine photo-lyase